jgi:hypothetical protein
MDLWSYKVTRDYGFAPNPFFGSLTLGCCKPNIRKRAGVGDLVVGCGSAELALRGRVIFAMRVEAVLSFQQYWDDPHFRCKRPEFTAGQAQAYGDNIYHHNTAGDWIQEDSHHSFAGGAWNDENAKRDLKADAVLIATEFVYWGDQAPLIPPHLRNHHGEDLFADVRDYRRDYSEGFKAVVSNWFDSLVKGRLGRPVNWSKPARRNVIRV